MDISFRRDFNTHLKGLLSEFKAGSRTDPARFPSCHSDRKQLLLLDTSVTDVIFIITPYRCGVNHYCVWASASKSGSILRTNNINYS